MTEPTTREEYEERFAKNTQIFGMGMTTSMSMPCPFCAAPNFMRYMILQMEEEITKEHVCKECSRGMRAQILIEHRGLCKTMHFIQTRGPDCTAEWVPPMHKELESVKPGTLQ